jgi:hypothetical protein
MDGILPFLAWMEAANSGRSVTQSMSSWCGRLGLKFDAVVTREDAPPKPARNRCSWHAAG